MIHRYIGREGDDCLMLGDGNVARIEDCRDARWLKKAEWWYRLRFLRRWLLPVFKALHLR